MTFNEQQGAFDLVLDQDDFALDEGLETAVILSLFADARAPRGAGGEPDRRGWWGDAFPPVVFGSPIDGDAFGSRLWTLAGARQLPETAETARQYAKEALAWMIADGVAQAVDVQVDFPAPGVLSLGVNITKPAGDDLSYRWRLPWQAMGDGNGV